MKYKIFLFLLLFFTFSCFKKENIITNSNYTNDSEQDNVTLINTKGNTIETRFKLPNGYIRQDYPENSYPTYLRTIPLLDEGTDVLYYNGKVKTRKVHAAVLNISVGDRDLQQCADAVMRLKGEYLYKQKDYNNIHFNFGNNFRVDYSKWAEGYRIKVNGNKFSWTKLKEPDYSYTNFLNYMFFVYAYAGTLSLSQELKPKQYKNLEIGDVIIQGGSPGHAVTIMDVAVNPETNKKIYLLSQSYMPAQSIHILKNLNNEKISPWYELKEEDTAIHTPEWTFKVTDIKSF